jgi:roadblock/LC7 domain-containing protein
MPRSLCRCRTIRISTPQGEHCHAQASRRRRRPLNARYCRPRRRPGMVAVLSSPLGTASEFAPKQDEPRLIPQRPWTPEFTSADQILVRPFSGVRSPLVPLVLVVVQQALHRSGANQWFSFPFHVLAIAWLCLVAAAARGRLTRLGGSLAVFGAALNATVVAATNGMMPIDSNAWARAHGGPLLNKQRMHAVVSSGWRHFFGDRFAVPSLGSVVSAGDLLLVVGAVLAFTGLLLSRRLLRHQISRRFT